jgi:RNA polymerase sigma factor (sigma-70 family)
LLTERETRNRQLFPTEALMSDSTTIVLQNLLTRFAGGDGAAKKELIDRAHDRLILVARKLLGSFSRLRVEEETAGVLNDAYLRLHTSLDDMKPASVREFMGLAALEIRRALLDRIRKMDGRGKAARPTKVSIETDNSDGGYDIPDPHGDDSRRTLVIDLLEALAALPEEERETVELLFFHGCTQPEAAAIVGVHEDTIKRRWSKARIKLAGKLAVFAPTS